MSKTKQDSVTDEDFNLAIQVIAAWHAERKVPFAIVNSGAIMVARQGDPMALEATLRHAYEQLHAETAIRFHAQNAAGQVTGGTAEQVLKDPTE